MLINTCKRKIKEEFDIKICNLYKHYWYLSVYCYYLTRSKALKNYKYLFIDEAQDLSISELELIRKINTIDTSYGEFGSIEEPVMNVFGDVNQMITEHGISTWRDVDFIDDQFELEENFRNTNQVVDFCNRKLTVQMQKIGVDMDEVQEFDAIEGILKRRKTLGKDTVLIVKDEYAEADLKALLQTKNLEGYPVYTVKAAKGLEFREVYVFNRDMTHNEKYIAYTRALAKLTVISTLPHVVNQNEALFVEGEDLVSEETE